MRAARRDRDGSRSQGELATALWVGAALVGALELAWWLFARMYSA